MQRLLNLLLLAVAVSAIPAPRNFLDSKAPSRILSARTTSPTVAYASDDSNDVLFGTDSGQRGELGGNVIGPNNRPIVYENPDLIAPPTTDHGTVNNIKWPFSLSHNRLQTGGWARQQNGLAFTLNPSNRSCLATLTVNVLPVAEGIAGVNMRLEPGAYREMHWHSTAEWAYMIKGGTRISTLTPEGKIYVGDVNAGDLWYFPAGMPHSIQAFGPSDCDDPAQCDYDEGAEFLLIFNNGDFDENDTLLLTDWLAHTPKSVIAKNFQMPTSNFDHIPSHELYIFPGTPPPKDLDSNMVIPNDTPEPYTFAFSQVEPVQKPGGTVKIADSRSFKVSDKIAVAEVVVEVDGIREMHWHPTMPEWTYFVQGTARMTVFAGSANAQTYDFQPGDVAYISPSFGHYIENIGDEPLKFLEILSTDRFQDISLQQWLALTPHDVVKAHLGLSDETINSFSKEEQIVV